MFNIYLYYNELTTETILKKICSTFLMNTNSDTDIISFKTLDTFDNIANSDISLYFLENQKNLDTLAERIHNKNILNYIVVIVDNPLEVIKAIKPSIRPSGVIIKPIQKNNINNILNDITNDLKKFYSKKSSEVYVIKTKAKDYAIPINDILFFESRNKKVFLNTISQELGFYESLDAVMSKLNDDFIRVHKGFIVNIEKIASIDFRSNIITLNNQMILPLSRTYKSAVKDKMNERGVL
ncbi:MAG: LytTR family transcriptional regulator [Ruminococcus sp.]|nr:LytTR family transcriptional regulator [Ruminococcus sp.]